MSIGKRIKQRRVELGLSQEEIGKALGKNQNTIAFYEADKIKTLKKDVLDGLCRVLKCEPDWLLGADEITLRQYPHEIRVWLSKQEANDYVLVAYHKYLQDKMKTGS